MNTKGMKFLAVLAVLAMAFAAIAVLDVQQTDAVEGDAVDVAKIGDTGYKTLEEAIAAATGESTEIVLLMDVTATLADFTQDEGASEKTIAIDLAGYTLTLGNTDGILIENGVKLIFNNGNILANSMPNGTQGVFCPQTGSSVEINKVIFDTNGTAFYPRGDAAKVVIEDSEVTAGTYAVGTNAATLDNYGVKIIIDKSTLISTCYADDDGDTCTVMLNVAGSLNITDSTINGKRQVVFVRAGEADLKNVNVEFEPNFAEPEKYKTDKWGSSGNEVPEAAIVIGNDRDSAYKADANVTLNNVAVTIKQNDVESKQCFDVLWIEDYKNTEEETADAYKTNVNIDNLTVPATGIVTIKAGTVNETNITAEKLTAGAKGMTISKGSVVLSGDIDGGEITGDVTIKDANILGDLTVDGTITIDGTVNVAENVDFGGTNAKFKFIGDGAKIVGLDFGGDGMMEKIELDPKYTLFGSKAINLSGFPVIDYNGKSYVIFNVDFGGDKGIQIYGIQKVAVPYTGEPIDQEDVTVAGTSFNADGQTMKSITFTELPGSEDFDENYHAGASHTYQTKISTAYNGGSQYFSVKVPYEVTQVDSEVVFSEYDETTVEGIEIDKIMPGSTVEMSAEVAHTVIIDAEVKYYSGDDDHEAGYYIVAKVASADPEKVTLENAKYFDPISKEWKSLTDGYILAYIGPEFPAGGELITTVDIDLDGPEGCAKDETGEIYDDYKTTTYTVELKLTENLGIELIPITEDNLEDALEYAEPPMEDLYGKLPQELQTDIKFEVSKKEAQNDQPAALVYDVTITGKLNYVYDYDGWDTDAKGYFLAYYIALPDGKSWKNATVTFEKTGSDAKEYVDTFDGLMVIKVTKPGITQTVTIVIDDKTFIWNLKFDAFDAEGEELLTFEPAATYEAVMPEDKTVFGITLDDTTDKTFYMVFMNTIKSDLTINLYYLGNKTEKEEGAEPIYTEDKSNLDFWAEKDVGMYIWYASFEYQLKDIDCKGGNYLIEVLGEKAATEQEEAKDVLVAKAIAVVSGQESMVDFAHVNEDVLYGKNIEDIVDGELAFDIGTFVPTGDNTGYYPVNVTGKIHYVKEYTGYSSKAYYQSGFYLPFDILVGGDDIPADYPNMTISLKALQGERSFVATDLDGIFVVFIGKDSSKFPEITVKIDLDGEDFAVFKETTYVLSLAPVDGDGGVTVGNLDIILVDEANEVLTFNIPEGKYFKLPNGKDNTKEFDAWNLEEVQDTYSDESVYVVSYNDVTTEGEYAGKVVFTATYKGSEPVPPQPEEYSTKVLVSVQQNTVTLVALDGLKIESGEVTVTFQYWAKVLGAWRLVDKEVSVTYEGGDSVIQITVDVPDVPASISYVKASFVSDSGYSAPESGRTVYVN